MTTVGSYEAKTHLPALLQRVARGEKILITVRNVPVALLSPAPQRSASGIRDAVAKMRTLRRGHRLGKGATIRDLVEEGRRF